MDAIFLAMKSRLEFGLFFKKFRLRSEFQTLTEFGKSLGEMGLIYEDSTFSRWEGGTRIPKNRGILLKIIELFVNRGGIKDVQEANCFLESTGQGYLTKNELNILPHLLEEIKPFQAPRETPYFTGREGFLKKIKKKLFAGEIVLIHGAAGTGKTTLAIKLTRYLKEYYPDGVLWLRLDTSSPMGVLISIAETLGERIPPAQNVDRSSAMVMSLLSTKKALIVFDNAEPQSRLDLFIPNLSSSSIIITSRSEKLYNSHLYSPIHLKEFSEKESLSLFEKRLGKKYVLKNKKQLLLIGDLLGHLPLAIDIIAYELTKKFVEVDEVIEEIMSQKFELKDFTYENRNLYSAISLSHNRLSAESKSLLTTLGLFGGKDFSLKAVSYIENKEVHKTKRLLLKLIDHSLLEYSSMGRFRLHPMIRYFLHNKKLGKAIYKRAIDFYIQFLKENREKISYFPMIEPDIFNMHHLVELLIKNSDFSTNLFSLWKELAIFLWFGGYWEDFLQLNLKIYVAALKGKNYLLQASSCIELSTVYYWRGDLNNSQKYTLEAKKVAKKLGEYHIIAQANDRLGKICQLREDFEDSEKYLNKAFNYFKNTKDFEKIGNVQRHFGEGYMLMNDFNNAGIKLKGARRSYGKIADPAVNYMHQSLIDSHLGIVLFKRGDFVQAIKLFISSLKFEKKAGGKAGTKIGSMLGLALIHELRNNFATSEKFFVKARKESKELGIERGIDRLNVCMAILKKDLQKSHLFNEVFDGAQFFRGATPSS